MNAERVLMAMLLGVIGVGCAYILYPFFSAILWAAILVFTTWPVHEWLRIRLRLPHVGAASLMVLLTAVLVVLPIALAAPGGAEDVGHLRHSINLLLAAGLPLAPDWLASVPLVGHTIAGYWNAWVADFSVAESFFRPYLGLIAENLLSVLLGVAGGVVQFLLALFIAFFFWFYGAVLGTHLQAILRRIAGDQAERLLAVTGTTVRGTVYGILGTALIQGILTAIGLMIAGVPRPVLLGALAGLIAVFPIGAPVVWIPAAIWLMATHRLGHGIFLAVYGTIVISGADHLIRPYFIARGAKLPFLLTVLGVLGGVLAFGILGIFLGPVLLGVGFSLVAEFARAGERRQISSAWQ